jgi:hypothetical protein
MGWAGLVTMKRQHSRYMHACDYKEHWKRKRNLPSATACDQTPSGEQRVTSISSALSFIPCAASTERSNIRDILRQNLRRAHSKVASIFSYFD